MGNFSTKWKALGGKAGPYIEQLGARVDSYYSIYPPGIFSLSGMNINGIEPDPSSSFLYHIKDYIERSFFLFSSAWESAYQIPPDNDYLITGIIESSGCFEVTLVLLRRSVPGLGISMGDKMINYLKESAKYSLIRGLGQ